MRHFHPTTMSLNRFPTSQSIPDGFELIGDFSAPAEPKDHTCQYTSTCKNPAGRKIPAGQPFFFMKSQFSDVPYLLCEFCKAHVDQKPSTKIRQVPKSGNMFGSPTHCKCTLFSSSTMKNIKLIVLTTATGFYGVDPVAIRAASSASQRGGMC